MAKVFRIFVVKKRGNDIEAGQTLGKAYSFRAKP